MSDRLALLAAAGGGVWDSLLDILILLAAAMVLGAVAERLRQSAVVGYLVAGTLVGPGALGWVADQEHIFHIAELGVVLLLFTIGLEFSPQRLRQLGRVTLVAGPLQVALTTLAGMAVGVALGFGASESFVVGAMIALSSTACVLRVLRDRAELDSPYGRVALGVLLVQDAAVVPLVLVVSALSGGGSFGSIATEMAVSILLALLLIALFYLLFNRVIPRVLEMSSWRRNRDLPIVLTVCMVGGAAWAAQAVDLSPALGAFLAGILLAVSPFATQILADAQPLRAVLVTLFFAAIGMFGELGWLVDHLALVAAVSAVIILGKLLIVALLVWAAGLPLQFAVAAGFCLAQIGEFSFVVAMIARDTAGGDPLLSPTVFRAIVSATILTLLTTPYLIAVGPRVGGWLQRVLRRWPGIGGGRAAPVTVVANGQPPEATAADRILVIGFGPAGQRVAEELLAAKCSNLAVLDINIDNVRHAKRYGLTGLVGDATQTDVLEHAGIHDSRVVVITVPTLSAMRQLVHHIRHLAPGVLIVARSRYHVHRWELLAAGAHAVVDEEDHVGHRMALEVQAIVQPDRPPDESNLPQDN